MMFFSREMIHSLGLTLLDSLWQGALVLFACGGLLWLLRDKSSRMRYYVVLVGLISLPVMSVITFSTHYSPAIADEFQVDSEGLTALAFAENSALSDPTLGILDQWHQWAQANAGYISLFWAIGFMLFAFRLAGGFYMVRKLKNDAQISVETHWLAKLKEMCADLNIKIPVELRESAKLNSPIVLGYLKPIIIFPIGLLQGLPTDQVEAILLHELAHIKRFDYLVNVFVSLLQVVFFYHPAYWWLQSQLDSEREYSCDDLVLNQTGNSLSLIKALTAVREFQITGYSPSLAFAGQKNQLLKRVERIMKKKTRTNWLGGLISMFVLLLSFSLMSYQSRQDVGKTSDVNDSNSDSTRITTTLYEALTTMASGDSIPASKLGFTISGEQQSDTLSLQQAILDLMDKDQSGISMSTDGDGNIISIKKNGKALTGKELETYSAAYARLHQYVKKEQAFIEDIKAMEQDIVKKARAMYSNEQLNRELELMESLQDEAKALIRNHKQEMKELRDQLAVEFEHDGEKSEELVNSLREQERALLEQTELIREMELVQMEMRRAGNNISEEMQEKNQQYVKLAQERLKSLARYQGKLQEWQQNLEVSDDINELLKYYPEFIRNMKPEDLVNYDGDEIIRVDVKDGPDSKGNTSGRILKTFEVKVKTIRQFQIANGQYEFKANELAQYELGKISESTGKPLIVVDDKIRKDWTYVNLNELDKNLIIKAVEVTRVEKVTDPAYKNLMTDRDVLIEIKTTSGGKKFKRPKFYEAKIKIVSADEVKLRKQEEFTKSMLNNLKTDGLLENGWSELKLSSKALLINGKSQTKQVLKKYLKLYKEITGDQLRKNKTIEIKE